MNFFGKSDIGTRDNNEDCFGIYEIGDNACLFAVCDGMGGESSGEIASRLALESFSETVLSICKLHLKENKLSLTLREAELILANARKIAESGAHLIIRVPTIPGFNDTEEEIRDIARFAASLPGVEEIHLLPYHRLGYDKYVGLGREYGMGDVPPPTKEKMEILRKVAESEGLKAVLGG